MRVKKNILIVLFTAISLFVFGQTEPAGPPLPPELAAPAQPNSGAGQTDPAGKPAQQDPKKKKKPAQAGQGANNGYNVKNAQGLNPGMPKPQPVTNPQASTPQQGQAQANNGNNNTPTTVQPVAPVKQTPPAPPTFNVVNFLKTLDSMKMFAEGRSRYGHGENPFNLRGASSSSNPFNIRTPIGAPKVPVVENKKPQVDDELEEQKAKGANKNADAWLFYVLLSVLSYFTVIFSVYRQEVSRLFSAFSNINIAQQQFRDKGPFFSLPDFLLYVLFVLAAGSTIFLTVRFFNLALPMSPFMSLVVFVGGAGLIYILKHLELGIVSLLYPFGAVSSFYSFIISNTNKVLGICLVPINFLIAFTPENMRGAFIYVALGMCLLFFIYRSFRGFAISGNYMLYHKFHFIMYLCTVEIAPILILIKCLIGSAAL